MGALAVIRGNDERFRSASIRLRHSLFGFILLYWFKFIFLLVAVFFYNFYVFFCIFAFRLFFSPLLIFYFISSTLNIFNGNFMFEIYMSVRRLRRCVNGCVWGKGGGKKANNYFSIIKIISNAQFFISNWLVRIYVFLVFLFFYF